MTPQLDLGSVTGHAQHRAPQRVFRAQIVQPVTRLLERQRSTMSTGIIRLGEQAIRIPPERPLCPQLDGEKLLLSVWPAKEHRIYSMWVRGHPRALGQHYSHSPGLALTLLPNQPGTSRRPGQTFEIPFGRAGLEPVGALRHLLLPERQVIALSLNRRIFVELDQIERQRLEQISPPKHRHCPGDERSVFQIRRVAEAVARGSSPPTERHGLRRHQQPRCNCGSDGRR